MTSTIERILIAVDETTSSASAVEQGLALAASEGATVVFVHVVSIAGERLVLGEDKPDRVPDRAQTAELVDAGARAAELAIPYTTELLIGYPPAQIAALADELDVDLVVVGARHLSGVRRFLLGSTSRALIGESSRPLLVVPESAPVPALST